MKKIITLLFSVGAFATSFAQYHPQNNDDKNFRTENERDGRYANSSGDNRNYRGDDKNRGHFNNGNNPAKIRDFQIEKINRNFNYKVQAIQNDRQLRRREKKAAIRNAQSERSRQIQMVNERFKYSSRHNH